MTPLRSAIGAGCLFLAGVALRAWHLPLESPDFYEAVAHLQLRVPITQYLDVAHIDFSPPLFYLLYHPGVFAGAPIWLSRLTSVLIGAAVAPILYLAVRRILGDGPAFLAGIFLTLNPLHVELSQQAVPAALGTALFAGTLHYWYRSSQTFKPRHWIPYSVMATALVYAHPGGGALVIVLMVMHWGSVAAYKPPDGQRRVRRLRLLGIAGYNYLIIAAVSAPWIMSMRGEVPWHVPYSKPLEALRVYLVDFNCGTFASPPLLLIVLLCILAVLLLPPFIGLMTTNRFAESAPLLMILASFAVIVGFGQVDRARFLVDRDAPLVLPAACLILGILVWRCNLLVRTALAVSVCGVYLVCSVIHLRDMERLPWRDITKLVKEHAAPDELVIFWPDYTDVFGRYFLPDQPQIAGATDVFQRWAEMPEKTSALFMVTDWPMKSEHLYTFPGALSHHAKAAPIWRQGRNYLFRATDINWTNLKLWYDEPDTLRIVDQPTSNTQFLFTPGRPVFRDRSFVWNEPSLCYDEDGRRSVWTIGEHTDIDLDVSLSPGSYVLRVHCSPTLVQPDGRWGAARRVTVSLRSGDELTRADIDRTSTLELPFSTDVETRRVPLHLTVNPTLKIREPIRAELGLKIYSIAIEQEFAGFEAPAAF